MSLEATPDRFAAADRSEPSRFPRLQPGLQRLATWLPTLPLAGLITILAWPFLDVPAVTGLDPSWRIGLHMGTWLDLRQGVDLVFTYGPLGFLSIPTPYLGATSLLALIATVAVYLSLVTVLLVEARRVVPSWAAGLVVLAIARTFVSLPPFEAFQALTFIACVEVLAGRIRLPAPTIAAVLGVAAGVALLGKLNVGVFVASMGAVTALAIDRRWWRGLAVFAAASAATGLLLWIATGQAWTDLPDFVSGAVQTIGGYSEAMGTNRDGTLLWVYMAFVGLGILFGWTAFRMSEGWPRASSRRTDAGLPDPRLRIVEDRVHSPIPDLYLRDDPRVSGRHRRTAARPTAVVDVAARCRRRLRRGPRADTRFVRRRGRVGPVTGLRDRDRSHPGPGSSRSGAQPGKPAQALRTRPDDARGARRNPRLGRSIRGRGGVRIPGGGLGAAAGDAVVRGVHPGPGPPERRSPRLPRRAGTDPAIRDVRRPIRPIG